MEFVKFCMDFCTLVWNLLILVWILDFWTFVWNCLMKKKIINPCFFYEIGSKRTLLRILVVFWTWVG